MNATVGDIVTWTSKAGRTRIGRVAAALEYPAGTPAKTVTVATTEGDFVLEPEELRVVRPNFVQETRNAAGDAESPTQTSEPPTHGLRPLVNRPLMRWGRTPH